MAVAYQIAEILKTKGYAISDCIGIRHDKPHCDKVVGILKERRFRKRASHIGSLLIKDFSPPAKLSGSWVLEVYGKKNVEELSKIKDELSAIYETMIEMREKEQTREELYPHEYGCGQ